MLLGLTDSGKTNFIVALDVVLDHQTDSDGLTHSSLAADRTYLQPLKEKWLLGEVLPRTDRQPPPPPHQLHLRHPASGTTAGLHLPDLAGETFDAQFQTRSFSAEFADRVKKASGLFLFIHCGPDADHVLHEAPIFSDLLPATTTTTPPPPEPVPANEWGLEDAARQVKLVDLLQFIDQLGLRQSPIKIAVMLSAWDLVDNAPAAAAAEIPKNPTEFLSRRWPLLDQFLRNHPHTFEMRVFGVSARGGGNEAQDIAALIAKNRPVDRITLVDGAHRSNDLTRPVRWLLGLLQPATQHDA